ncbi:MAG: GTP cyclohydrolase I FolE2 [Synergistes sp.]|nr:GTP cyclohydrolase I FolE2 [Synergistes sp.]MCR5336031.1 GTP cyclohydrolase FolE2 [Synergistes sp.]
MRDIQSETDYRNLGIDRVGIRDISWPISVPDRSEGTQETIANVSLSVSLPHDYRGTHMSRFVEVLSSQEKRVTFHNMEGLAETLRSRLSARDAHAVFDFPYFITKSAPVSGAKGRVRCDVRFDASLSERGFDLITTVTSPVQTLCPCSKEISEFGAHNQRAHAVMEVRLSRFVWLEEFVRMADECASAPIYSLLKREDEKYITEHAYMNPKFVEDTVRDLALKMNADERVLWYRVSVSSHESIHNHDAFAEITGDKRNAGKQ